ERHIGWAPQAVDGLVVEDGDDFRRVLNRHMLVEDFVRLLGIYRNKRTGSAKAHAACTPHAAPSLLPLALDLFFKCFLDCRALGRHASGGHADIDRVDIAIALFLFRDGDFLKLVEHRYPPVMLPAATWLPGYSPCRRYRRRTRPQAQDRTSQGSGRSAKIDCHRPSFDRP